MSLFQPVLAPVDGKANLQPESFPVSRLAWGRKLPGGCKGRQTSIDEQVKYYDVLDLRQCRASFPGTHFASGKGKWVLLQNRAFDWTQDAVYEHASVSYTPLSPLLNRALLNRKLQFYLPVLIECQPFENLEFYEISMSNTVSVS